MSRVLIYKPPTRERNYGLVDELVTTLNFATGLELSADENILYVAEGARSRIFKYGYQAIYNIYLYFGNIICFVFMLES